jgi:hypothetical protein
MKEVKQKLDPANQIVNHFFSLGARVSKKDYDYVVKSLDKAKKKSYKMGYADAKNNQDYGTNL